MGYIWKRLWNQFLFSFLHILNFNCKLAIGFHLHQLNTDNSLYDDEETLWLLFGRYMKKPHL